ncbi:MAG: pre-peptidase C-terminal domain-containing protein [Kangiellaceae bacterium]|nr:pre-peptidase C-terminal domain-containing protein [Kangiellaceae bacterium]MCW8998015.1 pre-peptidase C-terminal domain-containing protein [Kangiellaceae bacterium]
MSGSCNVDVICSEGDGWRDQIRSAAAISTGGSGFCSGGALNNTSNDGRGFFLTAYHCGITSSNAPSLVTYWNFENSYCRDPGSSDSGSAGDGTLTQFNTGAIFRAAYSPSDMTLVELDDPFDPAHNVYLAGWNAGNTASSSAVAIHHPSVDEKRISFENDATAITSYGGSSSPGDSTHIRVIDWDLGTTEPGSSGSHLFDQNKRVIGQLHGGGAACGNNSSDWYGWLNSSWSGGGTNSTRLSNWLDPNSTGQIAIDGMNATGAGSNLSPTANANGPYSDFVNNTINFSSAGSNDPDGSIVSYLWNFGDGSATSGTANPTHAYTVAGNYNVSLTVTDNEGATGVANTTATITVEGDGELTPGVAQTGLSGDQGTELRFYMDVPANAVNLTFDTSGGTGDADLYVRFGSEPTTSDWDCRPYSSSGTENCSFNSPQEGRYYVMVRAYGNISGYQLVGNYSINNGQTDSFEDLNVSASRGEWKHYTLEVTAEMTSLTANTSGGTGDSDLYVRFGTQPTTGNWDCRPYTAGNTEECSFNNPQVGTWYISVRAYRAYSGVDISGIAQ